MRVTLQRVKQAAVSVEGEVVGAIGMGYLLLVGVTADDQPDDIDWLTQKLVNLRLFSDAEGVMNRSALDVGAEMLAVSQFTLYASVKKGNRPSWSRAAPPEVSRPLFDAFVRTLSERLGRPVPTGVFGADMQVSLQNDGPVTLWLDSRQRE
ncbi:D-aminoacyl-tRNA deacylase [Leeia aquatica]|uniref:D-aminoacyl-tRNA deacylase n=1 Tax=Leeia aquatica TaxID=2725557 RepID=A0A847RYK8_9NEIS|nr:D-aminoacyl-tRNA deacylase [Leeia aquatica]NLR76230.1 D-tyrosyl-tRNA(Tyr) deacylase [Leeia aquatica]